MSLEDERRLLQEYYDELNTHRSIKNCVLFSIILFGLICWLGYVIFISLNTFLAVIFIPFYLAVVYFVVFKEELINPFAYRRWLVRKIYFQEERVQKLYEAEQRRLYGK